MEIPSEDVSSTTDGVGFSVPFVLSVLDVSPLSKKALNTEDTKITEKYGEK
jgi:hypothetical protein